MPIAVTVSYDAGLDSTLAALAQSPAAIQRAKRRTLAKLARWLDALLLRVVAVASGLTGSKLRASARYHTSAGRDHLAVWIGTADVKVRFLGSVSWSRQAPGASVGSRRFAHAWAWDTGRTAGLVMRRRGADRLPIAEVVDRIHPRVLAAVQAAQPQVEARYLALLSDELRIELERLA